MKSMIVVALALVAVAVALPVEEPEKILESNYEASPDGEFKSSFRTENGINREDVGSLKEVKDEDNKPVKVLTIRGSYTYTDTDGVVQTITYLADENGYTAEGPAIPKNERR
ncbi:hypothetical protein PYW08_014780 [Mythimna loreyi]|uniref:Uncharacterized protein n=1 Tax=Mythimna loreyi TaxID=667449 RepID=A0ACC2R520_9NEOP|nr:hypothetical protein PYW08_014780 [Mythimna loreyi]